MRASFATLLFAFFICTVSSRSIPSPEYDNVVQFDDDRDSSDETGLLERLQQLQNGLDGSEELDFDSESFGADDDDDEQARATETDDEATLDSNEDVDTSNELYDDDDDNDNGEWRVDDTYDTETEEDKKK